MTAIDLRPWHERDAAAVAEACNDPDTARYLWFLPQPYTREDALEFIGRAGPDHLAIVGADDLVLGSIGYTPRSDGVGEVGYWVAPRARGRGVAATALARFTATLLEQGVRRVYLETDPTNIASQRTAAAAGFTREGIARASSRTRDGVPQDMIVWSRVAGDPPGPLPRLLPDLPGGELTDGVVTLRPIAETDAEDTYTLRTLPEVRARSAVGAPPGVAAVRRQCAESGGKWLAGQRAEMTVRDAADGSYLGEIALYVFQPALQEAMIGYSLTPAARGKGYAARAARLATQWGFDIGMVRMISGTAPDNVASQRVLESAGYVREGLQLALLPGPDGTRIDNVQFAKLRPADM